MDANARSRLIDTTARLLQTQGYHNTGLNQILAESQAPKGSLYHYFPGGKVDLAIAAIQHSARELSQKLTELCLSRPGAQEGLDAVIEFFQTELEQSNYQKGCPVATITLEQAAFSEPIQKACEATYAGWQTGLEAWLQAHQVADAPFVAEHLLTLIEGALVLARARRSGEPLRKIRQSLPLLLNR